METSVDFDYSNRVDESGNTIIEMCTIKSDKRLTAKQALSILKERQAQLKPCNAKNFKPVAGISHFAVWGWSPMFETVLFSNIEHYNYRLNRPFASEPTGKYGKKRNEFTY